MKPEIFTDSLPPATCPVSIIIKSPNGKKRIAVAIVGDAGRLAFDRLQHRDNTSFPDLHRPACTSVGPLLRSRSTAGSSAFARRIGLFARRRHGNAGRVLVLVAGLPSVASWRAALLLAHVEMLIIYKRSLNKSSYSLASWCSSMAGLVRGLLLAPRRTSELIPSRVLRKPTGCSPVPTQNSRP